MRHPPLRSCVWRREGCCVPVGSERWPTDSSSSQNSILHMFSSLTHSPHTDHDLTHTAVSSGAIHLFCSLLLNQITPIKTCSMLLTCSTHINTFYPSFLNICYTISSLKLHVKLKIICSCWRVHMFRSYSWQRQHLVAENVTAGTGQQNVEVMFKKEIHFTHVAQQEYHRTNLMVLMFRGTKFNGRCFF